jgi:hypothetical protein
MLVSAFALIGSSVPALAGVTISAFHTENMSCSAGVCAPTAADAVLNATDLEGLLASGNVEITTTGVGVQATNIKIDAKLAWSGSGSVTFDAYKSVTIDKPTNVKGTGGFSVITNDGGNGGEFLFGAGGNLTFANLSSPLMINGTAYTLESSVAALASAIAGNPSGAFALANSYDAGHDGIYSVSPISTVFTGAFNGLGNTISNLTISDLTENSYVGLFAEISGNAALSNLRMTNANVAGGSGSSISSSTEFVGALVGYANGGSISYATVAGVVTAGEYASVGGLVGVGAKNIVAAIAAVNVSNNGLGDAGGIDGTTSSGETITNSRATGSVSGSGFVGGVVGFNSPLRSTTHLRLEVSPASIHPRTQVVWLE